MLTYRIFDCDKEKDKYECYKNISYKDLFHEDYFKSKPKLWEEGIKNNSPYTYSNYQNLSIIKNKFPEHFKFSVKKNLYKYTQNQSFSLDYLNFRFTENPNKLKEILSSIPLDDSMWFLKKNANETFGGYDVYPVRANKNFFYRNIINNMKESNKNKKYFSVDFSLQKGVENPKLTPNGHKYDIRVYMLINFIGQKMNWFLFDKILLRKSLYKYDPNTTNRNIQLTNTTLSKKDLSEDYWEKLTSVVKIDKTIESACKKIKTIYSENLNNKEQKGYHLIGLDFIYDTNDKIYLLEINNKPQIHYEKEKIEGIHHSLEYDMFSEFFKLTFDYLETEKLPKKLKHFIHI